MMKVPGRKPLPTLEDLPLRKGDPPFSAWDLWENAEVDSLDYLSGKVVPRSSKREYSDWSTSCRLHSARSTARSGMALEVTIRRRRSRLLRI